MNADKIKYYDASPNPDHFTKEQIGRVIASLNEDLTKATSSQAIAIWEKEKMQMCDACEELQEVCHGCGYCKEFCPCGEGVRDFDSEYQEKL